MSIGLVLPEGWPIGIPHIHGAGRVEGWWLVGYWLLIRALDRSWAVGYCPYFHLLSVA